MPCAGMPAQGFFIRPEDEQAKEKTVKFTDEQKKFLVKVLAYNPEDLTGEIGQMEEDFLLEMADRCFDVELEGDLADGPKMPDQCRIAADIYSMLGGE